jgi:hypothetical protein
VFPLYRLRLRALRIRLLDQTLRRVSRRHRLLAAFAGVLVARAAADRILWRGAVRQGEGLVVRVRDRHVPGAD